MERLTPKEENGNTWSMHNLTDIVNKLAHYEDLEEQGLLLKLPCKVGDTVWVLVEELEEMYEPDSKYHVVEEANLIYL